MPEEQTTIRPNTGEKEALPPPHFVPADNGHDKTTPADGHGATKYAPSKPEGGEGVGDKNDPNHLPPPQPYAARRRLLTVLGITALVILALIWGVRYYNYSTTHVSTDDAYVTGNLVNVSPIIGGTLSSLTVDEGDTVHRGQLIGRLEDSGQLAALRQSQAAYDAAESQIPQAQVSLDYQKQATDAGIKRAQAALAAQQAQTSGAQQQAVLSGATLRSQVAQAQGQLDAAEAQATGAQAQARAAQAQVSNQQQAVETAQRAADAVTAQIASAAANATKASNDEKRYARLVRQEAVTPQQYDAAQAAAVSAAAQLQAAQQQAAQARSQVAYARGGVQQALDQLRTARAQANAAREQADVARAGLGLARANLGQVGIQQANVVSNVGKGGQAQADLATALANRQQTILREKQILTSQAQAEQANAALANARVTENDTYLYAPTDGYVVKKAANIGSSLSPGQSVVTLTQGSYVWVSANFKETQLKNVVIGQPCEVEVDTFPGIIFSGKVQAINEATGASLALLPPDNSTGNFTKVVQRIPVKIQLVPATGDADKKYARQSDILRLHQGLSVTAVIDTTNQGRSPRS